MKKALIVLLTLIICTMGLVSCSSADDYVPAGYVLASSKDVDYKLYVPETWVVDMSTGVTTAYVSSSDLSNISFMGFELDSSIISIIMGEEQTSSQTDGEVDKDDIVTVDDYWKYYSSAFEDTFSDMEYEAKDENTVLGSNKLKAKKYVYTATVTGIKYRFMQVVAIKNKTVYIFTYTAREDAYINNIDKVNEILGYLEVK